MVSWFSIKLLRPFNEEIIVFSTNCVRITGYPYIKEWSCTSISQQIKNNSVWIKDLTFVRSHTIKLSGESTSVNLCDFRLDNAFLYMTLKA